MLLGGRGSWDDGFTELHSVPWIEATKNASFNVVLI